MTDVVPAIRRPAAPVAHRMSARRLNWISLLVWTGGVISIAPLVWSVYGSFRPDQSFAASPLSIDPHQLTWHNYQIVFSNNSFFYGFRNSAIQVLVILATTLFFCPLAGYGFAKFTFRGKTWLFSLMLLTLFFVPLTQYIPLLLEMNSLGWVNTYQALVLPLVISAFGVFWMTTVIRTIPDDLLHVARADGCTHFGSWWRIVMPTIQPALVSLAVVTFLTAYNDYFWPLLIMQAPDMQTIQVALSLLQINSEASATALTANWGVLLAGSTVAGLPTIVVFLFLQRYLVRGLLQGSIKG